MDRVLAACRAARAGNVVVLTGAGISAESGIPTFRGEEGYWTIGSRVYHPQELATHGAFEAMPWSVWAWYLYRIGVCRAAEPNAAHLALVALDRALGDRFALITQNVDGLHRRAGSPDARTFPIHGDISLMRCARACTPARYPLPAVPALGKGEVVPDATRALLVCPRCGAMARPHVLWFDEAYDEPRYHYETIAARAAAAHLLVGVGTSAQTTGPWTVVQRAAHAGATIVDVNLEENPFTAIAQASGGWAKAPAATAIPRIVDAIL